MRIAIPIKSDALNWIRYKFCGYTFQVPSNHRVYGVEIRRSEYSIMTDKKIFTMRACHQCKKLLTYDCFYERKSPCKKCHLIMVKRWQKNNPELTKMHKKRCNKNYRSKQKLTNPGLLKEKNTQSKL